MTPVNLRKAELGLLKCKFLDQEIRRWTQAVDPDEEKHVETVTVALRDENGVPLNPGWPELPPMTNPPPNVQPAQQNNEPRAAVNGWMNAGNNYIGQNNQNGMFSTLFSLDVDSLNRGFGFLMTKNE